MRGETIAVQQQIELGGSLVRTREVRWGGAGVLHFALGRAGVVECALSNLKKCQTLVQPVGDGPVIKEQPNAPKSGNSAFFYSSQLAESDTFVAVAAPLRGFTYAEKPIRSNLTREPFDVTIDIDVSGSRVGILGGRRDAANPSVADEGIVWIGSLQRRLIDLRPIAFSTTKARALMQCHFLDDGAIRYLTDGTLFVIPGIEPGAFLYDRSGRLLRTWQTDRLGILDHCDLSGKQADTLAASFELRVAWLNRFKTVDDIFEFDGRPAAIVRRSSAEGTRWTMLEFLADGHIQESALPFTSPSPNAHMKVDRRNSAIVILIRDPEIIGRQVLPPRLILARIEP